MTQEQIQQAMQYLLCWTAPYYNHSGCVRLDAMHNDGMSWNEIWIQLQQERQVLENESSERVCEVLAG